MGNPYVRLLAAALGQQGATVVEYSPDGRTACDIALLHWPDWVLDAPRGPKQARRAARLLAGLRRARRRGTRVVWTVHNLGAHDARHRNALWSRFVRHLDGFISLTDDGTAAAVDRFPQLGSVPAFVIPHGHYRDAYANTVSAADARSALSLEPHACVAVFLGQLRPYKNVPELIRTYREVDGDGQSVLVVAGRPATEQVRADCVTAAGHDPRVRLHLGFVAPDDVQLFMNAADVVVLPYRETLNSGAALLALSFDRPVLAPAAGAFVDLSRRLGRDWVRTYAGELTAPLLSAALGTARPEGRAPLDDLSWSCIARRTLDAFETLQR